MGQRSTKISRVTSVPAYLTDRGEEIYRSIAADLINRGILYTADVPHLAAYASQMAKFEEVQEELLNEEIGIDTEKGPVINPKIKLANQLLVVLNATAQKLGITPYGRGVSKRVTDPKDEKKQSPLLALLNAG